MARSGEDLAMTKKKSDASAFVLRNASENHYSLSSGLASWEEDPGSLSLTLPGRAIPLSKWASLGKLWGFMALQK